MLASEIKPSENLKILICGPAGTGKTCFAASLPTPILFLDFDGKVNSAVSWLSKDTERLSQIEVKDLRRKITEADVIQDLNKTIREDLMGTAKFKTVVVDSITTFSSAMLRHIVATNPGIKRAMSAQGLQPDRQDYGILKREFGKVISGFLSLPMNVVMLAHIDIEKSELTGEVMKKPKMDGSFGSELSIYFEEVWRSFMVDGKPWAQTKSDSYYEFCRSQIPNIPAKIEMNYEKIRSYCK